MSRVIELDIERSEAIVDVGLPIASRLRRAWRESGTLDRRGLVASAIWLGASVALFAWGLSALLELDAAKEAAKAANRRDPTSLFTTFLAFSGMFIGPFVGAFAAWGTLEPVVHRARSVVQTFVAHQREGHRGTIDWYVRELGPGGEPWLRADLDQRRVPPPRTWPLAPLRRADGKLLCLTEDIRGRHVRPVGWWDLWHENGPVSDHGLDPAEVAAALTVSGRLALIDVVFEHHPEQLSQVVLLVWMSPLEQALVRRLPKARGAGALATLSALGHCGTEATATAVAEMAEVEADPHLRSSMLAAVTAIRARHGTDRGGLSLAEAADDQGALALAADVGAVSVATDDSAADAPKAG